MRAPLWLVAVAACVTGLTLGLSAQLALLGVGPPLLAAGSADELSAGDIVIRLSGNCGAGFTEVTDLNGVFLRGTLAANADQGQSGGNDSITPAGTNSAPTLTMNSYTPQGTVSQPTFTGTAFSSVINHTHPVTDPGHNHTQNAHTHVVTSQTATTGSATSYEHGTLDTSSAEAEVTEVTGSTTATNIANTTGVSTQNPAGGVASITPAGSVSQPTFSGQAAVLTGSVAAPAFTGTAFDNKPAFKKVILCAKS